MREIPALLNANHRWYGNEVRLEVVNRIKLWRFLIWRRELRRVLLAVAAGKRARKRAAGGVN